MNYFIQVKTHQGFFEFSQLQASKEYAEERVTTVAMGGEYAAVRWVSLDVNGDIAEAGDWNGYRMGDSTRPRDAGPYAAAMLTRGLDLLQSEIAVCKSQIESLKVSQSSTQELPTVNAFRSLLDELSRVRAYCREELAVCQKEISKIRDKVEAQGNKGLGK